MPALKHLYKQRIRWQTGTLIDLRVYGFNRVTAMYWFKQLLVYANICCTIACWTIIIASLMQHLSINLAWTVGILATILLERVWSARRAGFRGVFVTLSILPESGYDVLRMIVFIRSLLAALGSGDVGWNHVE